MRRSRRSAAVVLVAMLLAGARAAADPKPSDVEEARRHYQRGVQLYEQGVDEAALAELERAYELAPSWKVLYDIGLVELQMHDFAGALRDFERYLDEGKDGVASARRTQVERRIAELRTEVATIDVGADPGARITLDDVAVGASPLTKPLVVNPGRHKVGASVDQRFGEPRVVSVAGGDHVRVVIAIPEPPPPAPQEPAPVVAPPPPAAPPPAPIEAPPPRPRPPLWIGWAATGALATGAIVAGIEALGANADLTRAKSDGPASGASLDAIGSRAHAWALASDVMTAGAIVAAGVTVYFTLRPASRQAASAAVAIAPNGVALRGSF